MAWGTHDCLEKRRKLRDHRNGTHSRITPVGDEHTNFSELRSPDSYTYWITILNAFSGEKITMLNMGWDCNAYDVTVEMVAYELEQWGRQTHQEKSKGYLEEGFSFTRNSNTDTVILPPETKIKELGEGHRITLKVTIKWTDKRTSRAEWLHNEHRDQEAITAVNAGSIFTRRPNGHEIRTNAMMFRSSSH